MKQKVLIISLFLVVGLVLSNLLAITSLSFTKQIKSTFSEFDNNELLDGFANPPAGEMTVLEGKEGVDEGIPVLMLLKDKFAPFVSTSQRNIKHMASFYIPLIILLFVITYFFVKRYVMKRKKSNTNRYEIEKVQKQPVALIKKIENDTPPFIKGKRVATNIQIHETRRLLQKWEAGLVGKRMKREAETINEWFVRIKGPLEIIPIYEKVRYGEKNCTEEEIKFIKNSLKL